MKISSLLLSAVGALSLSTAAHAVTLLDITDVTSGSSANYSFSFTATASSSVLTDSGYQVHSFTDFVDNAVVLAGTATNLLGPTWDFTPAAVGSDTSVFYDGTSVPGLSLGAVTVGYYDQYSQTFATTPGLLYTYSFDVPDFAGAPDGFIVTVTNATTGTSAVPEPATWVMLLTGFGMIGFAMRSRRQKNLGVACA